MFVAKFNPAIIESEPVRGVGHNPRIFRFKEPINSEDKKLNPKSIEFAKLAGTYKSLQSLLAPHGNRQRILPYFHPEVVQEIFDKYSRSASVLKRIVPDLYSDVPERKMAESSDSTIARSYLEMLMRDIEYIFELNSHISVMDSKKHEPPRRIFISHGSSSDWLQLQNHIEKDLGFDTLELAQEPNRGRTVLQKLYEESEKCSFAVVVMTGDDIINDGEIRARENVMHEIGFFQGKYGLENVCLLHEEGTNIPSNIHGLVYIPFPQNVINATFGSLVRELRAHFG